MRVITPSAPSADACRPPRSASGPRDSSSTLPVGRDEPQPDDLRRQVREADAGPVRRGRDRARELLAVDVALVLHREPARSELLAELMERDAASTSTSPPSTEPTPSRASSRTMTSSVHAMSVNECPDAETRTRRPSATARRTASTTASSDRGRSIR